MKSSQDLQKSEHLLKGILGKFFAQNPKSQVWQFAEHTAANQQRSIAVSSDQSSGDYREKYWKERKAHPNLYDIGANLEWHLLMSLMNLNPQWRHDGWWCDGVTFLDVALHQFEPNTLKGMAITYWETGEFTENKAPELSRHILAEIELKLLNSEEHNPLAYSISLWVDGHYYCFSAQDFTVIPCTFDGAQQPDIEKLIQIYQANSISEVRSLGDAIPNIVAQLAPELLQASWESPKQEQLPKIPATIYERAESKLSLAALILMLDEPEKRRARIAAECLGERRDLAQEAMPKLLSIVYNKDEDTYLRAASLEALTQIGIDENEAIRIFEMISMEQSWALYSKTKQVLAHVGNKAIPSILKLLKEISAQEIEYEVASRAFEYLRQQRANALPALLELIEMKDWRRKALVSLHYCGVNAIPKLTELLNSDDVQTRADAVTELGKIGSSDEHSILALKKALVDKDAHVCVRAIEALGKIGAKALPILLDALEFDNKLILCWAMKSISKISVADKKIMTRLMKLQSSKDITISYFATRAINNLNENIPV